MSTSLLSSLFSYYSPAAVLCPWLTTIVKYLLFGQDYKQDKLLDNYKENNLKLINGG
jgi:hypothetical protein